jgi:site-specific DNA-methyltransferase (cytosine-N4-specific)
MIQSSVCTTSLHETSNQSENNRDICERLIEVDWSFTKRSRAPEIEGIHPYPAKFIGDIPRTLISELPVPAGSLVLDPFCGSGTTLVEAQRAGLACIGVDLNPIACLITRVKTSPLPLGFESVTTEAIQEAQRISSIEIPEIPNVDHWFKPEVRDAVGALAQVIGEDRYRLWHDQLRLALSSIIVRVSNQDSDTRYAAVSNKVTRDDVFSLFGRACIRLQESLSARTWRLPNARVIETDTLKLAANDVGANVGLVITSPPYPNAYEYWLYHKYRMWWLGFDPIAVKNQEIGARAHFFKKDRHTAELFADQMYSTFDLLNRVVISDGFACFVIGRSKIHGEEVDNSAFVERAALSNGFASVARIERAISSSRKSFNLSHANIKTETLLVFQKI